MDFLSEARKALGKAAEGISRGADVIRLETEAADLSRLTEADWAAVGRRAQVLVKMGQVRDRELASLIRQAERTEERLVNCQRALQEARKGKRVRRCPACGEAIAELRETCEHCDTKLPVCAKCLEPLSAGDTVCPSCGTPVGTPESPSQTPDQSE